MIRTLVGLLVFGSCGALRADPLVYFALEGRPSGSNGAFASNVDVVLGDTVEYRLRAWMAPDGATNVHLRRPYTFDPVDHGLNSLSIALRQDATDNIQVDLNSPVVLTPVSQAPGDGWGSGIGATTGVSTPRSGLPWSDLIKIRPIHGGGIFTAREEEVIFTGLFDVAAISGATGLVIAEWGQTSGGGRFHGEEFYITGPNWLTAEGRPMTEVSSDPITHFTPLTLTASDFKAVPEPATLSLFGAALVGLALFRRRVRPRARLRR